MGCVKLSVPPQVPILLFTKDEKTLLRPTAPPPVPVREIWGKKAALATPISALAEIRFCSAWKMSGRRASNEEGRPAGTSGGNCCLTSGSPRVTLGGDSS